MSIARLTKEYTRDTSAIMQQSWVYALETHQRELAIRKYQNTVLTLHYLHDGVMEIWENTKWTADLLDRMLIENRKSPKAFIEHIKKYLHVVSRLKPYFKRGRARSAKELTHVVNLIFESIPLFDWMYYPSLDERTPARIRNIALKLRDKDSHFDQCDICIRKSLVALYPNLKGYEQGILRSEIANPPSLSVLKKRKRNFIYRGERETFLGTIKQYESRHPEVKFSFRMPTKTASILKGQIGNRGFAKGKVRVIMRKEQVKEATKGDIIVSAMTTPDFVPAMKKAAAIVTDEGGITCHAAIVSRELDKPCVIGTKFATQILKNGDRVEVDANKGIIKILSHAK